MITDTHTHLDFEADEHEVEAVLKRAAAADVSRLVTVGTDLDRSRQAVAITNRHEQVWATVGIHPDAADTVDDGSVAELRTLASGNKVVAIGETGLDLYHETNPPLEIQADAFRRQANLAHELGLPLVVHSRHAEKETLSMLKEISADRPADGRGVVHCFEGDLSFAENIIDLGYLISFTANITYPKNDALRDVVRQVPLKKFMLETDAPFLPPQGKRGERNESANTRVVAEKVAKVKGITLKEVAEKTSANAAALFKLAI